MSKKQIIAIIATLLLLIAIPLGMYLARKQQTVKSRATVDETTPGDINGDWCVDERDYAYWRRNYPNPAASVSYDKYTEWFEEFKSRGEGYCVSPAPAASPSP